MAVEKAPGVIFQGIDDKSSRLPTPVPEILPDSLPIVYIFAQRGDRSPRYVAGNALHQVYGPETWQATSPYFTHSTAMAKVHGTSGIMVQRLIPPEAKQAMIRLSLLVVPSRIPVYKRSESGAFIVKGTGLTATLEQELTESGDPKFINGYRTVILAGTSEYSGDSVEFGKATNVIRAGYGNTENANGEKLGVFTDENGVEIVGDATIYPIMDALILGHGKDGNNYGIRLRSNTQKDRDKVDYTLVEKLRSMLYRTSIVRRNPNSISSTVVQTVAGLDYLDLGFSDDLANPANRIPLSFENRLFEDWDLNQPGYVPEPGPFEKVYVYQNNLAEAMFRLTQGEEIDGVAIKGEKDFDGEAEKYGRDPDYAFSDPTNTPLFNILLNTDYNGVPYFAVDATKSASFGGIAAGREIVLYADGGADGLPLKPNGQPDRLAILRLLDNLTREELEQFGNKEYARVLDMARYPIRAWWDSGYSLPTKIAAYNILGKRPDMYVVNGTQSIADWIGSEEDPDNFVYSELNTDDEDRARALHLSNAAYLYPESIIFGTQCCRALIVGHGGQLMTEYPKPMVPLTFDLADKVSSYMGAAKWRDQYAFDTEGRKDVKIIQRINNTWRTDIGYDQAWDNNLIYVQYGSRQNLFYPQYQTVYRDDTSVLNDAFVMMACCSLEWLHFVVWRELTPTGGMSDAKLIEESNRKLAEKALDRFNQRFIVEPETTITTSDELNGRSWHSSYHLYANASRDRVYTSVVTHRMSDLQN